MPCVAPSEDTTILMVKHSLSQKKKNNTFCLKRFHFKTILRIIACSTTCDLWFFLCGMLWCFEKYGSINSASTGSLLTQYTGREQ